MPVPETVVLLFAKAPVEGSVNTRLVPSIGIKAATALQHELIHHRLKMLSRLDEYAVELHCAPDTDHPCFKQCESQYGVLLVQQQGLDLGERMFNAVRYALNKYKQCILIGTDAPALDAEDIRQAAGALQQDQCVFVPAEDGGYVLVGTSVTDTRLFANIDWGSERVMQQTEQQLETAGLSYRLMEECWDIDHEKDYLRYCNFISPYSTSG